MNLLDHLAIEALKNMPNLSPVKIAVEKELLHHDILRILSKEDLLKDLTFIGGTYLRTCYGGNRLSEDLDFASGKDFTRDQLSLMGQILVKNIQDKYGLFVKVHVPTKDKQHVDIWKIIIETRSQSKSFSCQRINIDIYVIPSYEKRPMLLYENF